MRFRRFIAILSVAGMLLFAAAVTRAQTVTGSIGGTVTDASGAVVPNATVTARNIATGVQATTRSNQSGKYNFQFLPIGSYSIICNAQGFAKATAGPLTLEIDQIAKVDLMLQVGSAETTVKVSSEGAVLQTQSSSLATTVTANTIENLPLSGNNFQVAGVFVPGAVLPRFDLEGSASGFERDTSGATLPSFNGNRQQGNNYILDGIEINEPTNNLVGYNVAPQALQEMRTITANADAEYGDVNGGEMVLVTKGGTNQFHGSAYEYYENQALTANLWSNNNHTVPTPKGVFHQNIFGVTFGGPVVRNKLFFFVDYEGVRNNASGTGTASVATALMRTGDFSELLNTDMVGHVQLYDIQPSETNPTGGWAGATPYDNNQIPINNPVAAYLFAHPEVYPMPNQAPDANHVDRNNYHASTASKIVNNQGDIRVDWVPDSKDQLLFRYSDGEAYDVATKVVLPIQFPPNNEYPFHSGVVNWVHTFSPALVNQGRAGISRVQWFNNIPTDSTGQFQNGNQTVGIPAPQSFAGFSLINLSSTESNVGNAAVVQDFLDNIFDYGDDLVWQHGNHTTKFGVQIVRYQQNNYYAGNYGAMGQFIYDGTYTGNGTASGGGYGFADFVLDQADVTEVGGVAGPVGSRQYRDAFYVQDDWKVLPTLTLNLGLRYGYDQPMYEVNNKEVNVDISKAAQCTAAADPSNPCLMFAGQNGNSRALYEPFYGEAMPRIGFAWQFQPRWVLRGGYGITDFLEGTGSNLRPTQNPPYFSQFVNTPPTPGDTSPGNPLSVSNGFSNGSAQAATQYDAWDKHLKPAMVQQFNLTTEYLVTPTTTAQVGYVGEVGQHLIVPAGPDQWTQPYTGSTADIPPSIVPFYNLVGPNGRVVLTVSSAVENYNALQATLRHRQSNGLEYTLNYTWSKSMTNNPGFYGISGVDGASAYWQNYYDPKANYGQSGFDVRNSLNGTAVWQLPFGQGRKFGNSWGRATDEVLGGWRLSGDVMLHSGFPINMTGTIRSNVHAHTGRASQYRTLKIVHQSVRHWFGTDPSSNPCNSTSTPDNGICAFGSPAPGEFGNVPPNNGPRAPGYRIIDMSLFKSFRTFEDQNLTFRVDAFNAFNMASYAAPTYVSTGNAIDPDTFATDPDASAEGEITSTLSPARQFQLSLIYKF